MTFRRPAWLADVRSPCPCWQSASSRPCLVRQTATDLPRLLGLRYSVRRARGHADDIFTPSRKERERLHRQKYRRRRISSARRRDHPRTRSEEPELQKALCRKTIRGCRELSFGLAQGDRVRSHEQARGLAFILRRRSATPQGKTLGRDLPFRVIPNSYQPAPFALRDPDLRVGTKLETGARPAFRFAVVRTWTETEDFVDKSLQRREWVRPRVESRAYPWYARLKRSPPIGMSGQEVHRYERCPTKCWQELDRPLRHDCRKRRGARSRALSKPQERRLCRRMRRSRRRGRSKTLRRASRSCHSQLDAARRIGARDLHAVAH